MDKEKWRKMVDEKLPDALAFFLTLLLVIVFA